MLTIEPPFFQIRGSTVFRDHADPDQLWVLPPVPRLVVTASGSSFTLYKYRRDLTDNPDLDPTRARGAGLALFEVEIPIANQAALQADAAAMAGRPDARLYPVLFRSGRVRAIVARSEQDRFVEDLVDERPAPITHPHRAAFAMALTAEGATLFEAAARGGQVPAGVAYELRFLALTPSLHARVRMDYDRIYDHFSASAGFTYYVSARFDLDLARLVEEDLIHVDIVSFTDGEDMDRQRRLMMDLVRARIQADFFRSGIPPQPPEGVGGALGGLLGGLMGGDSISSAGALFVLKARVEGVRERKEFDLVYEGRAAVELPHVATGLLSTMTADGPAPRIQEIDTDDPFFSSLQVEVVSAIDFEDMADLREVAVHLTRHDRIASYSLSPTSLGPHRFEDALTDPRDDEYRYAVEYHFDPGTGGGAPVVTAGPFPSRRRILVVDPLAHLRYVRLQLILGPVDPSLVPRILVTLRIPGEPGQADLARDTVELSERDPVRLWRWHLSPGEPEPRLLARIDWEDARGTVHEGEEAPVAGDSLVVLGPYRDLLEMAVVPAADWTTTSQVLVEVRYEDGEHRVDRMLTFDPSGGTASQSVSIPLMDPIRRTLRWRQVIFRADGTVVEGLWGESDRSVLVVGREETTTGLVRVVWVGDKAGAFGLRVDFRVVLPSGEEENVAAFLRPDEGDATVTLPLIGGELFYRYEVRRIGPDGEAVVRSGEDRTNLLVIQA